MPIEVITLVDPGGYGVLNQSDRYWLIRDIADNPPLVDDQALPSTVQVLNGILRDAVYNILGVMIVTDITAQQTSATSGVYGFAAVAIRAPYVLVPPGYYFGGFSRCLAYQGTLEELSVMM